MKTARAKVAAGIMLDIEKYMNGNTVPTVKYFVIDDNFYYKSMRAPYVSFARFNKLRRVIFINYWQYHEKHVNFGARFEQ